MVQHFTRTFAVVPIQPTSPNQQTRRIDTAFSGHAEWHLHLACSTLHRPRITSTNTRIPELVGLSSKRVRSSSMAITQTYTYFQQQRFKWLLPEGQVTMPQERHYHTLRRSGAHIFFDEAESDGKFPTVCTGIETTWRHLSFGRWSCWLPSILSYFQLPCFVHCHTFYNFQ